MNNSVQFLKPIQVCINSLFRNLFVVQGYIINLN